jgi:pimeloyl-ACP methyl ester carboxylesterase
MNDFRSFDGTRIAFHDEGTGPAVMLLHGWGFDGLGNFGHFERSRALIERTLSIWRETLGPAPPMPDPPEEGRSGLLAALVAAGARAIAVDLRGWGASDKPRDQLAYANRAMARDVAALITHLGLDAVDVLGYSMGAGVAASLLTLQVPEVQSAILVGIGQYALKDVPLDFPKNFPVPDHLPKPLTSKVWAEHGAATLERGVIERGNLASAHVITAKALGADPVQLAAIIRGAIAEGIAPDDLHDVNVPVLILNGRADVANQKIEQLVAAIPGARSASCDGDHYTTPFQPTFQKAVIDFFEEQWRWRR